jgi:hypothetical protein
MAPHNKIDEGWTDGLRVRVLPHPFWPDGATGVVRSFPGFAQELCGGASGCTRTFEGARGPLTMVWVVFDEPARDGDGDGPYREGEILATYLEVSAD